MSFSNKSEDLVSKLINTAGLCAVNLMTVHDQLWDGKNWEYWKSCYFTSKTQSCLQMRLNLI